MWRCMTLLILPFFKISYTSISINIDIIQYIRVYLFVTISLDDVAWPTQTFHATTSIKSVNVHRIRTCNGSDSLIAWILTSLNNWNCNPKYTNYIFCFKENLLKKHMHSAFYFWGSVTFTDLHLDGVMEIRIIKMLTVEDNTRETLLRITYILYALRIFEVISKIFR